MQGNKLQEAEQWNTHPDYCRYLQNRIPYTVTLSLISMCVRAFLLLLFRFPCLLCFLSFVYPLSVGRQLPPDASAVWRRRAAELMN